MNCLAFASLAVLLAGYCCVADDQTTTAEEANFATSADDRTTTMQETNPTTSAHDQITTMEESNPTTSAHYQITTTQEANLTTSAHDQITSTEQANPTTNAHDQITTMEQTNPTPSTAMAITTSGIAMAITTPSDATAMSVATSTVDGAGVLPTPPPTPAAPPAPTAKNSQWFIWQQATVRVSVDHTMCEGIVLAAHPQLPAEIECGEACEKWTTLRNSVEAAVIIKVVDMTLDVIDIPMSFIASTTHLATHFDHFEERILQFGFSRGLCYLAWLFLRITWITASIGGDIGVPFFKMMHLRSSSGIAEDFTDANCFDFGEGNQVMIYIKDTLAGAYLNGLGFGQILCGAMSFACIIHAKCASEDTVSRTAMWAAGLATTFSILATLFDMVDFWSNTLPLRNMVHSIEGAALGSRTFGDGTRPFVQ